MRNSKIHTTDMSHETAIGILKLLLESMQVYDGVMPTPERINALKMAIEDMELISKYADAYHKGYKDGAEAVALHEELSKEESGMVRKEDVIQILHKNWANHDGDDAMQMSIEDVRLL